MASMKEKAEIVPITIQVNDIGNLIYTIRDKQVMLDHDLAALYGYEVKRLNEQVKRNIARFPDDFMFQLTREEVEAVKGMLRHAFEDCGMQKVWCGYYEGNAKSKCVQEKCSFKF